MRFAGRIWKEKSSWLAEVPALDIMTQGTTKREAIEMIADAIEGHVNREGFEVKVFSGKGEAVEIGSNDVAALTALYLRRRRQASGLTLAEVAQRLGVKSHNAYARYEQGRAVPTIEKLAELLAIVDRESDIVISRSAINERNPGSHI
jgi:predicted RNase H-like HicB family nuclease/DNA-binding XRE family transcriptional regulator